MTNPATTELTVANTQELANMQEEPKLLSECNWEAVIANKITEGTYIWVIIPKHAKEVPIGPITGNTFESKSSAKADCKTFLEHYGWENVRWIE